MTYYMVTFKLSDALQADLQGSLTKIYQGKACDALPMI